ncbi:crotonobetainyl-CoA:carnitine CoA-transferase CaiB-like acyl-CoA transferase [Variovorax boronicumulans]|uniref:CaiB/BaiF CoA transferase family protein n=1 Tax=Variovorax boronicumulans TaxID=436515 RepID=UPI00277E8E3A|nr:CoA transferase [Variovorax boronicumulans]MDP9912266.1 crotonobetainyl-CoA:carnitine CoA-transferase CaiB-like acyl-CoA transferase [Variovorax boronicumulans]
MNVHSTKALAGIRVLDLTSVIMGPVCTQILADYGAQVVKVEPPEGDVMRHAGAKIAPQMGAMFLHANEGKRSVVLDLKKEGDLVTLQKMLPSFDVLIHNVRPQAMRRLGLDEGSVRALHPSILYVELTGYAQGGPYEQRAAFDDIIQAQVGLADLFARQSGGEPAYVPTLVADRVTGLTAAHATLAALYRRRETGEGETVRISMFETMAALVLGDHLGGASFEPSQGPMGYSRLLTRHRRPYRTLDGHIAVVVYNDKHWRSFFEAIGQSDAFEADPRFQTAAVRAENYDFIYGRLAEILAMRTTFEWLELLEAADIPCSPVNKVEDLLGDPQLRATGFFDERDVRDGRRVRRIASRFRSPTAQSSRGIPAPVLGQDTADLVPRL